MSTAPEVVVARHCDIKVLGMIINLLYLGLPVSMVVEI